MRDIFRRIVNKIFLNILEITPTGQIIVNIKNTYSESALEKALREIQVPSNYLNNGLNTGIPALSTGSPGFSMSSLPASTFYQTAQGGGSGLYQMSLSLDNIKSGTVHKKAVLNTRMYGANGGFVLEVQKHNNTTAVSDPTLYILRNEDIGVQLERIIALEFLQRE